jgi:hypothetical protein
LQANEELSDIDSEHHRFTDVSGEKQERCLG